MNVELINYCGDDLSVVNAARVSFDKYKDFMDKGDEKLIRYLARHKHYSPFNHAFMSFRVEMPVFVARQLVKHEYLPWNEVSRRYVDSEPEFFYPDYWRKKADNVKQGSSEEEVVYAEQGSISVGWLYNRHCNLSVDLYYKMLEAGVCPEQARMVLPQSMMTTVIWSGSIKAFAKMVKLRIDPHAQKEARIIAEKIKSYADEIFPVSFPALLESDLDG